MSLEKRILFGVGAGWLSRLINIVFGLLLTRVLFAHLVAGELGVWYLLGQTGAVLGLMDFGLTPTLGRRVAFIKGKSKSPLNGKCDPESLPELADLMATAGGAYRIVAIVGFFICLFAGGYFLSEIRASGVPLQTIWIGWTIMCLSNATAAWANKWNCLLMGLGYVGWDSVLVSIVSVASYLGQMVVLYCGGGIISLAIVATIGAFFTRSVAVWFIRRREPEIARQKGRFRREILLSMAKPALLYWLSALGGFMIYRTGQYFIAHFQGSAELPNYQAALQLVLNLSAVGGAFATVSAVFVSQLWQAGELPRVHSLVRRNMFTCEIIMMSGAAFLMFAGEDLLTLWLGPNHFVGYKVLLAFSVTYVLETHHFVLSNASRATEDEVYAPWAIASGVLNICFTLLLIGRYGLLGVAMATMFAQLLTYNWYGSWRGLRRLKMSIRDHFKKVVLPLVLFFACSLGVAWLMRWSTSAIPYRIVRVSAVAAGTGLLAAVAGYFLVLSPHHRMRLLGRTLPAPVPIMPDAVEEEAHAGL